MTETEQILTSILNCRRVDLYTRLSHPERSEGSLNRDSSLRPSDFAQNDIAKLLLTDAQNEQFQNMLKRFESGEPLQYILGDCEFMGLRLQVDRRVLIPRPETELLVEMAVEEIIRNFVGAGPRACLGQPQGVARTRILDLGTGSGNIAIALAKFLPQARIFAVDISSDALDVAQLNAQQQGVENRIEFILADMRLYIEKTAEVFDVIISNPPYIPTAQMSQLPNNVQQEPRLALDGGVDGLDFYRTIVANAGRLLRKDGWLFFEIGDGQRKEIENIFLSFPEIQLTQCRKDYMNTDRILMAKKIN